MRARGHRREPVPNNDTQARFSRASLTPPCLILMILIVLTVLIVLIVLIACWEEAIALTDEPYRSRATTAPPLNHEAVKCNPNLAVVRVLAMNSGCGFDCASPAEMDQVLGCGVDPSRVIYANPCKDVAALEHALSGERYTQRGTGGWWVWRALSSFCGKIDS